MFRMYVKLCVDLASDCRWRTGHQCRRLSNVLSPTKRGLSLAIEAEAAYLCMECATDYVGRKPCW